MKNKNLKQELLKQEELRKLEEERLQLEDKKRNMENETLQLMKGMEELLQKKKEEEEKRRAEEEERQMKIKEEVNRKKEQGSLSLNVSDIHKDQDYETCWELSRQIFLGANQSLKILHVFPSCPIALMKIL